MVNKTISVKKSQSDKLKLGGNLMFDWMDYRINQMQREATLREVEMSRLAKEARHPEKRLTITGRLTMTIASLLPSTR
jgi:hypothetical protein